MVRHSSGVLKVAGSRLVHLEKFRIISVLESYISNLGARLVLAHFWEYIIRTWITVLVDEFCGTVLCSVVFSANQIFKDFIMIWRCATLDMER